MDNIGPTEVCKKSPQGKRAMARLLEYLSWPIVIIACLAVGFWWNWWLCWLPILIALIGSRIYSCFVAKPDGCP